MQFNYMLATYQSLQIYNFSSQLSYLTLCMLPYLLLFLLRSLYFTTSTLIINLYVDYEYLATSGSSVTKRLTLSYVLLSSFLIFTFLKSRILIFFQFTTSSFRTLSSTNYLQFFHPTLFVIEIYPLQFYLAQVSQVLIFRNLKQLLFFVYILNIIYL